MKSRAIVSMILLDFMKSRNPRNRSFPTICEFGANDRKNGCRGPNLELFLAKMAELKMELILELYNHFYGH